MNYRINIPVFNCEAIPLQRAHAQRTSDLLKEEIKMTEKINTEVIEFAEGSVEAKLFEITDCTRSALLLPHSDFTAFFTEDNNLMFKVTDSVARDLFHKDILELSGPTVISAMDIILSPRCIDSFPWVRYKADNLDPTEYSDKRDHDQLKLLSYICSCFFNYTFKGISDLSDVTRPVPTPFFVDIVNKSKSLEVTYIDEANCEYSGALHGIAIHKTPFAIFIIASIVIISKGKDGYVSNRKTIKLPYVNEATTLEDIGLTPVTEEIKTRLTARGEKYVKYTKDPAYCKYNDFAFKPGTWFGDTRTRIDGRVMLDINAMRALNSSLDDDWYVGDPFNYDDRLEIPVILESSLWMTSPVVFGFSFATKEWVRMRIESVTDIEFSKTAFNELIVPSEYKDIFLACMTNDMPSLDSMEGKGNGKILLLHGPAGCGKTMTAESVAEYLKMPVYNISVGELGISPEAMETTLSDVMSIAVSWNAIVLLDEVDVFAVKRSGADIQRNAMTAILLRLLERFSGILFMTTNLVDNIDDAFKSRATATIQYAALNSADRITIWENLLGKANALDVTVSPEALSSVTAFAEHNLNGREIKNCVRLAYSMTLSKPDKVLTSDILKSVLKLKSV